MYAAFETAARSLIDQPDNDNLELIAYYTEHARRPAEGLRIARLEMDRRHDVRTLDIYAWALYVNGQPPEARRQIQKALAVGTRDAALYYHAGVIEAASGERSAALRYLQQSLDLNPTSEVAAAARWALGVSALSSKGAALAQPRPTAWVR